MITWLADYPKSGIGWPRMGLDAYIFGDVAFPTTRIKIDDLNEYVWQRVAHIPITQLNVWENVCHRLSTLIHLIVVNDPNPPLLVKTHATAKSWAEVPLVPQGLTDKAVYMIRDPRDIVASLSNYIGLPLEQTIKSLGQEHFVVPKTHGLFHLVGDWPGHVRSWTNAAFPVHVVRYEDMKANPVAEFAGIVEFLYGEADMERIEAAIEATDFVRLKARGEQEGLVDDVQGAGRYFRSGQSGGWKTELTDEQVARIEETCGEVMIEHGYELRSEDGGRATDEVRSGVRGASAEA